MKKVMAFGSFDIPHPGHNDYFRQAKDYGDFLVVVVSRNCNFLRFKNKEPVLTEEQRLEIISLNQYVDKAVLGNEEDFLKVIVDENPSTIVLGYDQGADEEDLKHLLFERGLEQIEVKRALPLNPHIYKSSKILTRFE